MALLHAIWNFQKLPSDNIMAFIGGTQTGVHAVDDYHDKVDGGDEDGDERTFSEEDNGIDDIEIFNIDANLDDPDDDNIFGSAELLDEKIVDDDTGDDLFSEVELLV